MDAASRGWVNDLRSVPALADTRAELLPLFEGHPDWDYVSLVHRFLIAGLEAPATGGSNARVITQRRKNVGIVVAAAISRRVRGGRTLLFESLG